MLRGCQADVAAYQFTTKEYIKGYRSNESDGPQKSSQRHTLEWPVLEMSRSMEQSLEANGIKILEQGSTQLLEYV